jgi:predicted transcriptional regulator
MQATASTTAEGLLARLSEPETSDALNRLLDLLPLLAISAEAFQGLIARGDEITRNIADQVSELRRSDGVESVREIGSALPGLGRAATHLAEAAERPAFANLLSPALIDTLGNPERLAALQRLFDKLDLLVFAVEAIEGLLRRSDAMVDGVRAGLKDAAKLVDPDAAFESLQSLWASAPYLLRAFSALAESDLLRRGDHLVEVGSRLVDSGLFQPQTVEMLAKMSAALAESASDPGVKPAKRLGPVGLLRALKEPDIQAAVSSFLQFSRRYGRMLREAGYA